MPPNKPLGGTMALRKLTFQDKVTDFSQAVREQILDAADVLLATKPGHDLGALRLLVSYFELIAKYEDGYAKSGLSKHYFVKGCRLVVSRSSIRRGSTPLTDQQLDAFYEIVRCGLAHGATLAQSVWFSGSNYAFAISADAKHLVVNPRRILALLRKDLDGYLHTLTDPSATEVRRTFVARWDFEAST
jgi:hypothetical protein